MPATQAECKVQNIQPQPTAPDSDLPHPVGSCYGGGVVFYTNGPHGLIAALKNASVGGPRYAWDSTNHNVAITDRVLFSGKTNTTNIIAAEGGADTAQAARAAASYNGNGYTDWYLPARDELTLLYLKTYETSASFWSHCGGSSPGITTYWSSTGNHFTDYIGRAYHNAFFVNFGNALIRSYRQNHPAAVRAIRAF